MVNSPKLARSFRKSLNLRRSSNSTSRAQRAPNYPLFRANSFPEVTNLFCRIPLPTFFYALEAIHLGNLRRFSVRWRVGRKLDPVIFKECEEITERNQKIDLALPQT